MKQTILVAEDEALLRKILAGLFEAEGYRVVTAATGREALERFGAEPVDLVVTDIRMPELEGLDLLDQLKRVDPEALVVIMTAFSSVESAVAALRKGAYDYIVKPFELEEVELSVSRALEHRRLVVENRLYQTELENLVAARTEELWQANAFLKEKGEKLSETVDELSRTYRSTLGALAMALDARDAETRGHSERVVAYSLRLGVQLGLSREELTGLERGALLHDVGKIGVRDAILLKPASLTPEEWEEMRLHTEFGRAILEQVPFLVNAIPVVAEHHERWDGAGYPRGLSGEGINVKARVFAVADCIDAVTSDRPYRRANTFEAAGKELSQHAGSQFDPRIVEAFYQIPLDEWRELRRRANELSILRGEDQWEALSEVARKIGSGP